MLPPSALTIGLVLMAACSLAPLLVLLTFRRQRSRALVEAGNAREQAEQLKSQLESVRHRTARLREDLSAADQQARLSHQLTLLGQFTAGFMHEFNNPLAIVTSRIEVLLEERIQDAAHGSAANERGGQLVREIADAPRVNVPGHVVSEVVRGLLSNVNRIFVIDDEAAMGENIQRMLKLPETAVVPYGPGQGLG